MEMLLPSLPFSLFVYVCYLKKKEKRKLKMNIIKGLTLIYRLNIMSSVPHLYCFSSLEKSLILPGK